MESINVRETVPDGGSHSWGKLPIDPSRVRKALSSKPFSTCPAAAPDTNWKKRSAGTNIDTLETVTEPRPACVGLIRAMGFASQRRGLPFPHGIGMARGGLYPALPMAKPLPLVRGVGVPKEHPRVTAEMLRSDLAIWIEKRSQGQAEGAAEHRDSSGRRPGLGRRGQNSESICSQLVRRKYEDRFPPLPYLAPASPPWIAVSSSS